MHIRQSITRYALGVAVAVMTVGSQGAWAQQTTTDSDSLISGKQKQALATQLKQALAAQLGLSGVHSSTGKTVEAVLRADGQYTTFLTVVDRAGLLPLLKGTVQDTTFRQVVFAENALPDLNMSSDNVKVEGAPPGVDVTDLKSKIMDQVTDVLTDAMKYAFAQDSQVTVFALPNAAFAKLPGATQTALTHDSAAAAAFVRAYLVNRGVYAQSFPKIVSLQSLAGTVLTLGKTAAGAPTVNGVPVVGSELIGDNGAVHTLATPLPTTPSPANGHKDKN